ncbi:hypothetical protein ACKKBF_B32665 [Auxenochlorella protothecoides x Auxenochlorella symbiontica]
MATVETKFAATSVTCSYRDSYNYEMGTFTTYLNPAARTATFKEGIDSKDLSDISSVVCTATDEYKNVSPAGTLTGSVG